MHNTTRSAQHDSRTLLVILVVVVVGGLLPPPAAAAAPAGCIVHAFTADYPSHHFSHLEDGALLIGDLLVVESDCGPFMVAVDGVALVGGDERVSLNIPLSANRVSVTGDNWSVEWGNLSFMAGSDFAEAMAMAEELAPDPLALTAGDLRSREVLVSIGTGLIVWVIVVGVLSRVIRYWFDHHFIEEVAD